MKKNEKNLNIIIVIICLILFSLFIYNYFFIVREGNENKEDTNNKEKNKIEEELDNLFEDIITEKEEQFSMEELLSEKSKMKNIKSYIKNLYEMGELNSEFEINYNQLLGTKMPYKSYKSIHDFLKKNGIPFFILDKLKKDYNLDLLDNNISKVKKKTWW